MIGFQYEKMENICTNCCRIMHPTSRCPFEPTNNNPYNNQGIQTHQRRNEEMEELDPNPISQPSSPVAQVPVLKEPIQQNIEHHPKQNSGPYFALAFPHFDLSGKEESTGSNIDCGDLPKLQSKKEVGECSKRRRDVNPKKELSMKKRSSPPDQEMEFNLNRHDSLWFMNFGAAQSINLDGFMLCSEAG
ncbi:PREDICTED: uncharacterized protein At4g02000-like [Camelina sativa]|uniref:Uncharacterized protein At4g02000-like n=1 Tax=Camelina sativa TaxID=90675 RepID=A0ABM0YM74_CAMSA|nr:PREDICTED: uncharacterized protein At4g02000-like [Camelina sativa]